MPKETTVKYLNRCILALSVAVLEYDDAMYINGEDSIEVKKALRDMKTCHDKIGTVIKQL